MNRCTLSIWMYPYVVRCLLYQKILLLWLVMEGVAGASGCPKLHFLSDHGCQPCSLCDSFAPENHHRKDCRQTNTEPLADGRVLWCDNPKGPFPECPPFQDFLLTSCSQNCTANSRKFAPGCVCSVGCPGQLSQALVCSETLQWSSTNIYGLCAWPSTAVSPVSDELTPKHLTNGREDNMAVISIVLGSVIVLVIVVAAVAIIGTCLCRRLRARLFPLPSGAAAAPLLSVVMNGVEKSPNGLQQSNTAVIQMDLEKEAAAGEIPGIIMQTPGTEVDARQQRETGQPGSEGRQSIRALQALLNSRQNVVELSRLFDQKYTLDRITWHDIALDLLGWDCVDVNHIEYRCRPLRGSPSDGPMYKVLEAVRQEGKGLLDLIDSLRRQRKHQVSSGQARQAEEWLVAFWQQWQASHAQEEQPC